MTTRLVIEIEQDSADFDQLGYIAMDFERTVSTFAPEAGLRVRSMTIEDEFGGLVTRFEPEGRTHFVDPHGRARTQMPADFKKD